MSVAPNPLANARYDPEAEAAEALLEYVDAEQEKAAMKALRSIDPDEAMRIDGETLARHFFANTPPEKSANWDLKNPGAMGAYIDRMAEMYPDSSPRASRDALINGWQLYRDAVLTVSGEDRTHNYTDSEERAKRFDKALQEVAGAQYFAAYRPERDESLSTRIGRAVEGSTLNAVENVQDLMSNVPGFETERDRRRRDLWKSARQAEEQAYPTIPDDAGMMEAGAVSAARSVPFTVGGMLSMAVGGMPAALAFTFSQQAPEAYREFRNRGIPRQEAAWAAATTGVIETAIEQLIPFDRLAGLKGVHGGAGGLRSAVINAIKEYTIVTAGESAEEIAQNLSRSVTKALTANGLTPQAFAEIGAEMPTPEQIGNIVITSGILAAPGQVVSQVANRIVQEDKTLSDTPSRKEFEEATGIKGSDTDERRAVAEEVRSQEAGKSPFEVSPEAEAQMAEADRQIQSGEIDLGEQAPAESVQSAQLETESKSDLLVGFNKMVKPGETVDGRVVRADIPNLGSIDSSIENPTELPGIREIEISAFQDSGKPQFYSKSERERTEKLAEEIRQSGEIAPLIVVFDGSKDGPYILEGGHRFDALKLLGAKSFPAMVVLDNDAIAESQTTKTPATPPAVEASTPTETTSEVEESQTAEGQKGQVEEVLNQPEQGAVETPPQSGESAYLSPPTASIASPQVSAADYGKPISNHEIIARISKAFDIPIRFGRIANKRAAGIYKAFGKRSPHIIRMAGRFAGHLGVAMHEVGHSIERNYQAELRKMPKQARAELAALDYEPQKARPREGLAEYIRMRSIQEPGYEALAPTFHSWFNKWLDTKPGLRAKLFDVQQLVSQWQNQGAVARGLANMRQDMKPARPANETLTERLGSMWTKAFTAVLKRGFNDKIIARRLAEYRAAHGEQDAPGTTLYEQLKAYTSAIPSHAYTAMEEGVHSVAEADYLQTIGPSLADAMRKIGPKDFDAFGVYTWARRTTELAPRNIETGMSLDDANVVIAQLETPEFKEAAEILTEYNNALLEMAHKAGVLTREEVDAHKQNHTLYVPLVAVKQDDSALMPFRMKRGILDNKKLTKRMKGADVQRLHPVIATMMRTVEFYSRAIKQQMVERLYQEAKTVEGGGRWVERVPPKIALAAQASGDEVIRQLVAQGAVDQADVDTDAAKDAIIQIYRPNFQTYEGRPVQRILLPKRNPQTGDVESIERVLIHIDPDMLEMVQGLDKDTIPRFLDMTLGKATGVFKAGATGLNMKFLAANMARDAMTYAMQTSQPLNTRTMTAPIRAASRYIATKKAHLQGKAGDPATELYLKSGGESMTMTGMFSSGGRRILKEITAQTTAQRAALMATDPIETLRETVATPEISYRLAEFISVLDRHGYDDATLAKGVIPPKPVIIEATNAAKDVTVDFTQAGTWIRPLNRITVNYINANVQSLYRVAQTFADAPKRTTLRLAALAALMVPYVFLRRHDPRYEEQEPWLKYLNWVYGDIRIPRSYEWGLMLSLEEALISSAIDGNLDAVEEFLPFAAERLVPGANLPIVTPAFESYINYDFFRNRKIDPENREVLNEDQYDKWTLETSKAIGRFLGLSPRRVEHFLKGVTGGAFTGVGKPLEKMLRGEAPFSTTENPLVDAFTIKRDYVKSINEFYEAIDYKRKEVGSGKFRGKIDPAMVAELKRMERHASVIAEMRKSITDTTPDEKRAEVGLYMTGQARAAIGKPENERYRVPFGYGVPDDLRKIAEAEIVSAAMSATENPPKPGSSGDFQKKLMDYGTRRRGAVLFLKDMGIEPVDALRLMQVDAARKNQSFSNERITRLIEAYQEAK